MRSSAAIKIDVFGTDRRAIFVKHGQCGQQLHAPLSGLRCEKHVARNMKHRCFALLGAIHQGRRMQQLQCLEPGNGSVPLGAAGSF